MGDWEGFPRRCGVSKRRGRPPPKGQQSFRRWSPHQAVEGRPRPPGKAKPSFGARLPSADTAAATGPLFRVLAQVSCPSAGGAPLEWSEMLV